MQLLPFRGIGIGSGSSSSLSWHAALVYKHTHTYIYIYTYMQKRWHVSQILISAALSISLDIPPLLTARCRSANHTWSKLPWLDQDWLSCTRRHVAPSTAMKMYAPYLQLVLSRALLCSPHAHNCTNVLHKRAGHTSEPVKILDTWPSTINSTSIIRGIETKQIAL